MQKIIKIEKAILLPKLEKKEIKEVKNNSITLQKGLDIINNFLIQKTK